MHLSADGKSFAGSWKYAGALKTSGSWHGTLVQAVSWTGRWSTNWGVVTLTQTGSTVTGSYPHDSGKISGTVSGSTLTAHWSESPSYAGPDDAGPVVLTISKDGKSFSGLWAYQGQAPSRSWDGARLAGG